MVSTQDKRNRYFHLSSSLKRIGKYVGRGNRRSIASAIVQNTTLKGEVISMLCKVSWMLVGMLLLCFLISVKPLILFLIEIWLIGYIRYIQLHPNIINLLESYLSGRFQSVVVNGYTSDTMRVISGVPQGSVLEPLLFIMYVNSLCNLNFSDNCELVMYADDLVLYKSITSEKDWDEFQSDISKISMWTEKNHLSFNIPKCISVYATYT